MSTFMSQSQPVLYAVNFTKLKLKAAEPFRLFYQRTLLKNDFRWIYVRRKADDGFNPQWCITHKDIEA